jgi:hypothetical protein
MAGDPAPIFVTTDQQIDRVSALLTEGPRPNEFVSKIYFTAARIAVDIRIVESSLLTLGIADAVLPVLPGIQKLTALGAAALAAVTFAAAGLDIIAQLGQLRIPLTPSFFLPESDMKEMSDRLGSLAKPISAMIDKALEFLDKAGVPGADMAALLKQAMAFNKARAAADKAVNMRDKLKHSLAAADAARKFFEKFVSTMREKVRRAKERYERERAIREAEPRYPQGVDYPNQPGDSGPNPNGGTTVG